MGAGPSLDGEIAEAKTIMADFLVKFAKNYAMLYAVGLAKESLKEQAKAAAGPKWELMKAQKEVPPADRKSGHMLKRSKHLKNWNRRFFVVRGNWIVDFWEKEEDFTAGKKPRGTMNLSGMRLIRDPNDNAITRILDLAKKCGLDVDALPKPEKYPDHSLEITHQTRETFLLQCETAEDHKAWCDILEDCRWYSSSLNIHDDKIHASIFRTAVWRTRWQCGIWGWWYSGGGEEQYITDCINDAIMDAVMPKVDAKLTMPWSVRSRIRTTFEKNVNTAVIAAVKPAWKAAFDGVCKVRPELKEKIAAAISPVGEAQLSLQGKIMEKAEQPSKDALNDKVMPHLDPLLQKLVGPVNDAFRILLQAYDDALQRGKEHYKPRDDRYYMVSHHSWNRLFWDADNKLWDLFDTLYDMRKIFDDVSPWGILGKARRRIRKHMQNALYTFETRLEEAGGVAHWDRVAAETREVLKRDCRKAIAMVVGKILFGVVENMWELVVIKPLRMVMAPLGEAIPDLVKQFVDPEDMLEKTLNNILLQTCINAFEPYASRVEL